MMTSSVLFVFIDGVGLGEDDADVNPVVSARMPALRALLDGALPTRAQHGLSTARATLRGLDASLGVAGLPQSGTGQTALLTGENAARMFGRHFGPWVPVKLRQLVAAESVLARAQRAGKRVAFANAYPEELVKQAAGVELGRLPGPLRAGPPLAALGAGLLDRGTTALEAGRAIASEITNDGWRVHLNRLSLPDISARQAGANLASIAAHHDLTMFAHYATDTVGHRGDHAGAARVLERVDAFLDGLLSDLSDEVLLVVASDHGNIEDSRTGHTMNPALCLVVGTGHADFADSLTALTDVTPAILRMLG
jgi:2,3-bisphosphoglycerate-independent phosphoglycerate mutase